MSSLKFGHRQYCPPLLVPYPLRYQNPKAPLLRQAAEGGHVEDHCGRGVWVMGDERMGSGWWVDTAEGSPVQGRPAVVKLSITCACSDCAVLVRTRRPAWPPLTKDGDGRDADDVGAAVVAVREGGDGGPAGEGDGEGAGERDGLDERALAGGGHLVAAGVTGKGQGRSSCGGVKSHRTSSARQRCREWETRVRPRRSRQGRHRLRLTSSG